MHAMSIVILHLINTAGSFQLHIHYKNKKKKRNLQDKTIKYKNQALFCTLIYIKSEKKYVCMFGPLAVTSSEPHETVQ